LDQLIQREKQLSESLINSGEKILEFFNEMTRIGETFLDLPQNMIQFIDSEIGLNWLEHHPLPLPPVNLTDPAEEFMILWIDSSETCKDQTVQYFTQFPIWQGKTRIQFVPNTTSAQHWLKQNWMYFPKLCVITNRRRPNTDGTMNLSAWLDVHNLLVNNPNWKNFPMFVYCSEESKREIQSNAEQLTPPRMVQCAFASLHHSLSSIAASH
jgi:hypothetical protein